MKWILIICPVLFPFAVISQIAEQTNQILESIVDEFSEEIDAEVYESLVQQLDSPIDINKTTRAELASLFILSDLQLNELMKYLKDFGPMSSIYELQIVPGFDLHTIKRLEPFIILSKKNSFKSLRKIPWRGYFLSRVDYLLEKKAGFTLPDSNKLFIGSPYRIIKKLRLKKGRFKSGFTVEKDAGESINWFNGSGSLGFDHMSGFVSYATKGLLEKVVLGDFTMLWGQGLVLGSGFSLGKSQNPIISAKRNSIEIQPYGSVSEIQFFRGAAITLKPGRFTLTSLYSNRSLDASVNSENEIVTVKKTGLHRNMNELNSRSTVHEEVAGLNVEYHNNIQSLTIGSSLLYYRYDNPFLKKQEIYHHFQSIYPDNIVSGIHAEYRTINSVAFSEVATSKSGGFGFVAGWMVSLSHSVETVIHLRNYSREFNSPFSLQAFKESSVTMNEKGVYWGINFKPSRKVLISGFADLFVFPWLTYTALSPSFGNDLRIIGLFFPSKRLEIKGSFRIRTREKNTLSTEKKIRTLQEGKKILTSIDIKVLINEHLAFKMGLRQSGFHSANVSTAGFLAYKDITFRSPKTSVSLRFAIIDSPQFENRFYLYEADLPYSMSVPMYYGKGIRYFVLLKRNILSQLKIGLKWSRTTFHDRGKIGSGVDLIQGNTKSEIKGQIIYKF